MRYLTNLLRVSINSDRVASHKRLYSTKENAYKIITAAEVPQVTESLRTAGWSVVGAQLTKTYEFKGFQAAWVSPCCFHMVFFFFFFVDLTYANFFFFFNQAFLTQVAMHAHLKGHHPRIENVSSF